MDAQLTVSGVSSRRLREAMYTNFTGGANARSNSQRPQPPSVYRTPGSRVNPKPRLGTLDLATLLSNATTGAPSYLVPQPPSTQRGNPTQRNILFPEGTTALTSRVPKPPMHQVPSVALGNPHAHPPPSHHGLPPGAVVPLTAARAVTMYESMLTPYEVKEIFEYSQVYFLGTAATKVRASTKSANEGYDDQHGDYLVVPHDHIAYRYEVMKPLGRGSFGQVLRCHDYKTGQVVALKIIKNRKKFHEQALVEVKLLEFLKEHDPEGKSNCIKVIDTFIFRNHMCITFEMLHVNLYEYVRDTDFAPFSEGLLRKVTAQLLTSLAFLWKSNIIHCDIKPENILLVNPGRSAIKLIDFGSSCFEHERLYTYIQSRFYRAPEIMLGVEYTRSIDIWSTACVMCELLLGYPIFPGESEPEQLGMIMECFGVPPREMIDRAPRKKNFFENDSTPKTVVTQRDKRVLRPLARPLGRTLQLPGDSPLLDLLRRMFEWDPKSRITPEEALRHPWVLGNHKPIPPPEPSGGELPYLETRASSARRKMGI